MTPPAVLAFDLSLTSTGVAHTNGAPSVLRPTMRGVQRLEWFHSIVIAITAAETPDLVVLEDYAFHGRNAHSHELGELGGVVRLALHHHSIPWLAVVPSSLKKYSTGKGNAGKEEVLASAIRRLGYEGHSHDEADALWLRAMALDGLGHPAVTLPADHRKALDRVSWPALEAPAA